MKYTPQQLFAATTLDKWELFNREGWHGIVWDYAVVTDAQETWQLSIVRRSDGTWYGFVQMDGHEPEQSDDVGSAAEAANWAVVKIFELHGYAHRIREAKPTASTRNDLARNGWM